MKVILAALFSEQYPAVGESHGISVVAGHLLANCPEVSVEVLDMVAYGRRMDDELLELVLQEQPQVIGLSVTYGTYTLLKNLVPRLKRALPQKVQLVYGGAIATYLAEKILTEIDPDGLVVVGEGEWAFAEIVKALDCEQSLTDIRNLVHFDKSNGALVRTKRIESPLNLLGVPFRNHLRPLIEKGIQLYIEGSRGCSWSHCTFCLRRLLDIRGKPDEFRQLPAVRIHEDLKHVLKIGGSTVTFADEDFFGSTLQHAEYITSTLSEFAAANGNCLSFDASMRVQSICEDSFSEVEQLRRHALIAQLKGIGLRKVFLGIESGSAEQLKRLAKGHSRTEASLAIRYLRELGVSVELGWIMFDPLCSLNDVEENITFLIDNNAIDNTSFLFSELRLQEHTPYMKLVRNYERDRSLNLITGGLDPDTLSYPYVYADQRIATIMTAIREWSSRLRPIHYPLKNMTRYGVGAGLVDHLPVAQSILSKMRRDLCEMLLLAVKDLKNSGRISEETENSFSSVLVDTATSILDWQQKIPITTSRPAILNTLRDNCSRLKSATA